MCAQYSGAWLHNDSSLSAFFCQVAFIPDSQCTTLKYIYLLVVMIDCACISHKHLYSINVLSKMVDSNSRVNLAEIVDYWISCYFIFGVVFCPNRPKYDIRCVWRAPFRRPRPTCSRTCSRTSGMLTPDSATTSRTSGRPRCCSGSIRSVGRDTDGPNIDSGCRYVCTYVGAGRWKQTKVERSGSA